MSHDEASESLAAAALDALSADEQAAVLAHAATCPQCGPELEGLRQAMAELGNSTPPVRAPASPDVEQRLKRIRMRLLARAQADRAPLDLSAAALSTAPSATAARSAPTASPGSRPWRSPVVRAWLAVAAAILIVVLLVNLRHSVQIDAALAQADERAAAATAALDTAQAKLAQSKREIDALTGSNTEVVGLNTTGAAEATALMFWDKTNNNWAFYAHHVAPLPAGKAYQIWLITPTQKISAGTFTPASDSSVEVHATYALPPNALKGVAVSEEPTGGAPQPTGRIVIVGTPGPK